MGVLQDGGFRHEVFETGAGEFVGEGQIRQAGFFGGGFGGVAGASGGVVEGAVDQFPGAIASGDVVGVQAGTLTGLEVDGETVFDGAVGVSADSVLSFFAQAVSFSGEFGLAGGTQVFDFVGLGMWGALAFFFFVAPDA